MPEAQHAQGITTPAAVDEAGSQPENYRGQAAVVLDAKARIVDADFSMP